MSKRRLRRGGLVTAFVAGTVLLSAAPASAAPGDGSAYGAEVNVSLLGAPAVQAGPFAAAHTDGPTNNSFAGVDLPGILNTGVITTEAVRDDESGAVQSSATTAGVGLPLLQAALGNVGAEAVTATCSATQDGNTGSTTLAGIDLGSLGEIPVEPGPNTTLAVALPIIGEVARLTFNEQIENSDGSLTVNAIHLELLGGSGLGAIGSGDLVISSATCGPAGLPVPLASGAGLWIGLGVVSAVALPVGYRFVRNRRTATVAS
ncbi:choice-of-anchor P family protein [Saccharomonospora sp. NPDC046836]|uniref:choice-of-anchor P family protein n=1 Tax=Saccharomonospora sp. NPDC046836 TaxID=3156921 RepID=UPI0033DB1FC8